MSQLPSHRSNNNGDTARARYERKLARQRQLELMEAEASGSLPTMELDTQSFMETDGSSTSSMRQRNSADSTTSRQQQRKQQNLLGYINNDPTSTMNQVNLMDHATGVYSTGSSSNIFSDAIMSVKQLIYRESSSYDDASPPLDGGDVYVGEDYQAGAKRRSMCGSLVRTKRGRRVLFVMFGIGAILFALYAMASVRYNNPAARSFHENEVRFNTISDHIIQEGISKTDLLNDPRKPEHHALRWVSYTDPARLDPNDPMILQRYALAVFYYNSFITFERIAGKQKPIEFEDLPQFEGVPNPGWRRKDYWMTERGVCSWWGVYCTEKNINGNKEGVYNEDNYIESLNLTENRVHGTIPPDFRGLSSLVVLDLSRNHLTGHFPTNVGHLNNLGFIFLNGNQLTGSLPTEIGLLEYVKDMNLGHNQLTGTIPTEINRMYHLRALGLEHNQFEGEVPMDKNTNLLALYLDNNKFSGTFPTSLTRLTNLYELRLHNNEFKGTVPPEMESLTKLEILQADHNQLTGGLPEHFFSDIHFIQEIQLQHNQLRGSLPAGGGGNPNLKRLRLDHNLFTGGIPEWDRMVSLQELHIYENKLDGSISESIGHMTQLRELWLQDNLHLEGNIPASLGNCTSLQTVYLQNNDLHGDVPVELASLSNLQVLRLERNRLHGSMPEEVCLLKDTMEFMKADCPPRFRCDCCNECEYY